MQYPTKDNILDLIKEIDAGLVLDEETEALLIELTKTFVETAIDGACQLAKHRKGKTVAVNDLQLYMSTT